MYSDQSHTKVVIICPVYKECNRLSNLIDSVRNQSWVNWELLIVDNASLDGTRELVFEKYNCDNRIKFFENKKSLPSNQNWMRAANLAFKLKYDAVCWVAGDDYWGNDTYLESLVSGLVEKTDIAMPDITYQFADLLKYFHPKFSTTKKLNHVRLTLDWRYTMVLYGLYTRRSFNKILASQSHFFTGEMIQSLDWWWTYSSMNFNIASVQDAIYVKTLKVHTDIDLYMDPTNINKNNLVKLKSSNSRLKNRIIFVVNYFFIEIYKLTKLQYAHIKVKEMVWVNFLMILMLLSRVKNMTFQLIQVVNKKLLNS